VLHEGELVVWTADLPGHERAVALFNLGEQPMTVDRSLKDFAEPGREDHVKNVWTGDSLQEDSLKSMKLERHGSVVLIVGGE
jgi:hypothetical protein